MPTVPLAGIAADENLLHSWRVQVLLLLSLTAQHASCSCNAVRIRDGTARLALKYTPVYVGTQCVKGAYDPTGCPVAGACTYGTTDSCLLWHRGVFVEPPDWTAPALPSPKSCRAASDTAGTFVDRVWTPDKARCRLACFTPWQAARLLRGKRLLFSGDSLLRQLFMHFVAFLRTLDVVEQPFLFHHGASYQRNQSADELCLEKDCLGENSDAEQPNSAFDSGVHLRYVWSPRHVPGDNVTESADQDNRAYKFSGALSADAVVVGLLYHIPAGERLASHTPALNLMASTAHVMWLTTPGKKYAKRNSAMRAWAKTQRNVSVLALDRLAADGAYQSIDGKHFACNVDARIDSAHQTACKDPNDTMNGNLVQMILAHLAASGWGAL